MYEPAQYVCNKFPDGICMLDNFQCQAPRCKELIDVLSEASET